MTYHSTGGLISFFQGKGWSGDAGGSYSEEGIAPDVDYIKLWSGTQTSLALRQGVYTDKYGKPQTYMGRSFPMVTYKQATELWDAWSRIYEKAHAALAGRPELQRQLNDAYEEARFKKTDWTLEVSDLPTYFRQWEGQYLYFYLTRDLFLIIDKLVKALNGTGWGKYNIEDNLQRARDSMPYGLKWTVDLGWSTAEGIEVATPGMKQFFNDAVKAADQAGTLIGFVMGNLTLIAIGVAGVYVYSKVKKK